MEKPAIIDLGYVGYLVSGPRDPVEVWPDIRPQYPADGGEEEQQRTRTLNLSTLN